MESVHNFTQAYSQAPWRKQLHIIGTFLLIVVSIALVAGIYLNVTARAAAIGREIQGMQVRLGGLQRVTSDPQAEPEPLPIEELEQRIADLQAELASLTSYEVMYERARALGLRPVNPEEVLYLEVPGYVEPQTAILAPPPEPVFVSTRGISPAFRQSLVDWVKLQILQTSDLWKEVQP